ncbi:LLM class flavin-dependent oxidoreductase [Halobacteriales archaeon Cl-PHB]
MSSSVPDIGETGFVLPDGAGYAQADLLDLAETAVAAGIDSIWAWEGWGYSPFTLLGRVAERTDCPLGTAICNGYARSPATLAMQAATLDEATDGRFVLGIGTSTPEVVENLHGAAFDRPLRRLRETIEVVDRALAGEEIRYDGAFFDLAGFSLDHTGPSQGVPVFNAALGPTNTAMTIEYADGLMPNLLPFEAIPDAVAAGAARADTTADLTVAPLVPTCVSDDPAAARSAMATHLASYLGPVEFYNDVVARHGYADQAEAIRTAWEAGGPQAAADAVSEDLLDAVSIAGSPEHARQRQAAILEGAADAVLLNVPATAPREMVGATIHALG